MDTESSARQLRPIGVYTKTIVRSPVVRWILHAQIRHRHCNEVIFIGNDFVQVKEVVQDGPGRSLQHVITKTDLDAQIRAAATFNNEDDDAGVDFLIKLERQRSQFYDARFPPQSIVLTLDSNDLVFLFLRVEKDGSACFVQQTCPMPCFDRFLFQPGEHLTVDPLSRALAVAANEREVIIYSAKSKAQIQQEISDRSETWCPVSSQRPLQVAGVIQQMEFLIPPADDHDHIVLLLIVIDQRRIKAIRIDWHYSSGPYQSQVHAGQPLAPASTVPSLLIPLRDASFLLIIGNELTRWKDILSGSASATSLQSPEFPPKLPGNSSLAPIWTSWTKPRRSQATTLERDSLYLVREDGLVLFMDINSRGNVRTSLAGHLDCHVGTAFASLGDEGDPDILAAAGEMSGGTVVSIGAWPSARQMETLSREDTLNFDPVESIPNWASITDMMSARQLSSGRHRHGDTDNVLVTSGRQPYGCITEVRRGVEARMSAFIPIEGLRAATDVWILPDMAMGSVIIVLSYPWATELYKMSAEFDDESDLEEMTAFATDRRTFAAAVTIDQQLIQVTDRSISASSSVHVNFEDTSKTILDEDTNILAASIITDASIVVTAERDGKGYSISFYSLPTSDDAPEIRRQSSTAVKGEPLCLSAIRALDTVIVLSANGDGDITLLRLDCTTGVPSTDLTSLSSLAEGHPVCDHVTILRGQKREDQPPALLAVCGLRDGRIVTFMIELDNERSLTNARVLPFGHSTVKLASLPSELSRACAMSDSTTCLLSWDGLDPQILTMENIWLTDKQRADREQGAIAAVTQMPTAHYLSHDTFAESLVLLSEDEIIVASLDYTPTTVPRQLSVSGTPNRLMYADALKCIVCSSLRAEERLPDETRQIWPVIDFIPTKTAGPKFSYDLQPGERVNALLEWPYRHPEKPDKTYAHLIVGGSYVRHNGTRRGRITFLQPSSSREWNIAGVAEKHKTSFDQEICALCLYDPITYIACAGENVHLQRFRPDGSKWEQLCTPFRLASPGVHITIETDHSGRQVIVISTQRDSIVVLRLDEVTAEDGSESKFVLNPIMSGPRADSVLRHYSSKTTSALYSQGNIDQFSLLATSRRQLIGMASPKQPLDKEARHTVGDIHFEAQLPCSLTRLVDVPALGRKGSAPSGVLPERIIGAAADGALVGIAILDGNLWRRLSWLQRMIEWSPELSPHSYQSPIYSPGGVDRFGQRERALPIGFSSSEGSMITLHTTNTKANDMHIDGDILARVLEKGGVGAVKRVLQKLVETDSAAGAWIKTHIDAESQALDELVELVRRLDAWM